MLAYRKALIGFAGVLAASIIVVSAWPPDSQADPADVAALYNEANAFYKAGRYSEAVERYEEVLQTGLQNGYAYYNLANAYFKSGQLGKAVLYYERALKLLPRDEDVRANLRFANLLKADKDPPSSQNPIVQWVRSIHDALNSDEQAMVCSFLFFLVAAAAIAMIFAEARWRSALVTVLVVLGLALTLSGVSLAAKIHTREFVSTAIVMPPKVDAMSGPGEEYIKHFTLHEGTKATIERESGGWLLIRLPNGLGGWVKAEALERI